MKLNNKIYKIGDKHLLILVETKNNYLKFLSYNISFNTFTSTDIIYNEVEFENILKNNKTIIPIDLHDIEFKLFKNKYYLSKNNEIVKITAIGKRRFLAENSNGTEHSHFITQGWVPMFL